MTDLCLLRPERETRELVVTSIHPEAPHVGIRQHNGLEVRFSAQVEQNPPPEERELSAVHSLMSRSARPAGSAA